MDERADFLEEVCRQQKEERRKKINADDKNGVECHPCK